MTKSKLQQFIQGYRDFYYTAKRWGVLMSLPTDPNMEISSTYVNIRSKLWSTINYYNHLRGDWWSYPIWERYAMDNDDYDYED